MDNKTPQAGIAGGIAAKFINSKLTPLLIIASLMLGLLAVMALPREEEPQISVPMIDVITMLPGSTSKEVEQRLSTPIEKWIWEMPGIKYVYSVSRPGMSIVTARFEVGANPQTSIVKLQQQLAHHADEMPMGASQPLIKERSIDDVPILAITLHSNHYDAYTLRRIANRVDVAIRQVQDVSSTEITGGPPREVRVILQPAKLAAYNLTPDQIVQALQVTNQQQQAGTFSNDNSDVAVRSGQFLVNSNQTGNIVVAVVNNRSVLLKDVAHVSEGPGEATDYVLFGSGPGAQHKLIGVEPAVTISIAKRHGTNAISVAGEVIKKVDSLKGTLIPSDVTVTVTRNYGQTASEKANDLLFHMLVAVVSVTLLIAFTLGRKESLVVAVAIPVTLALTLLIFYLYGYTLNRITLFALIFSIGILVDDAIVVVENIVRHYRLPQDKRSALEAAIQAVDEVGNPTLLATFTVIAAILPMAFVGGLMGPYMRPIPVGASAAMLISVAIAFIVTPWAAYRLLKGEHEESHREVHHGEDNHPHVEPGHQDWMTRVYIRMMTPLLESALARWLFLGGMVVLLVASLALFVTRSVVVKMLPFDNKNEFQLIVDMPNGTTLEQTAAATRALANYIATVPEVKNYQMYVGTHSPINFNGLVRQYYFRSAPYQADIQVNLVGKSERSAQSHDIVKRIRPELAKIAQQWGVRLKVAEVPPGPPVLERLVAEVYGPTDAIRADVAAQVKHVFSTTPGVVDVDWYRDDPQSTVQYVVDTRKAALSGVDVGTVSRTLAEALSGVSAGLAHDPSARSSVPIRVRVARSDRSSIDQLSSIYVHASNGTMVPLSELVRVEHVQPDISIYHKDLMPVIYVTGDVSGRLESPVYAILAMNKELAKLHMPDGGHLNVLSIRPPFTTQKPAMKWDGEGQITYEVFRDLGIAFAVVLVLIYILVVGWFQSFKTPLVIMAPIPLTLIGILPAHALFGAYFTATSMIGFIAGAGIIVRNSIILVDFTELRLRQGMPLEQAVIDAGVTRFRPMLLTGAAVIVGMSVILGDPIFQGLALALIGGTIASTLLSRPVVPVLYYMIKKNEPGINVPRDLSGHPVDEAVLNGTAGDDQ